MELSVENGGLKLSAKAIWMGEDLCVVADPLRGTRHVDKTDFLRSFAEVGSRAVVID